MKWLRIPKEKAVQPQTGSYKDREWKEQLAAEGFHQCVYCAIPDAAMGGIRNFHVEHYRPKSRFVDLENVFTNLFYSCPICNTFKGNDWPADPDHEINCYPDPSISDYAELFTINLNSGEIYGEVTASRYMIEKIHLNRGQLILERRLQNLLNRAASLRGEIQQLVKHLSDQNGSNFLHRYISILEDMHDLRDRLQTITPYQSRDVER